MGRLLGISFQLFTLAVLAVSLSSCASFFEFAEDANDPADADRGFASESEHNCDTQECEEGSRANRRVSNLSPEQQRIQKAIDARDVILGMSRTHVMRSWGEPAQRRLAGKGDAGHELWLYGMRNSLQGERVIVFENGLVAGWYR